MQLFLLFRLLTLLNSGNIVAFDSEKTFPHHREFSGDPPPKIFKQKLTGAFQNRTPLLRNYGIWNKVGSSRATWNSRVGTLGWQQNYMVGLKKIEFQGGWGQSRIFWVGIWCRYPQQDCPAPFNYICNSEPQKISWIDLTPKKFSLEFYITGLIKFSFLSTWQFAIGNLLPWSAFVLPSSCVTALTGNCPLYSNGVGIIPKWADIQVITTPT